MGYERIKGPRGPRGAREMVLCTICGSYVGDQVLHDTSHAGTGYQATRAVRVAPSVIDLGTDDAGVAAAVIDGQIAALNDTKARLAQVKRGERGAPGPIIPTS